MKITLIAEDGIRLEPLPGPMTIEAESADQLYSPFHMVASGLAFCTYSVLASWASNAKIDATDITVDVHWQFVEDPHRIGSIEMKIDWPSLPDNRHAAASRVAEMCAIHGTLTHSPAITTTVAATARAAASNEPAPRTA